MSHSGSISKAVRKSCLISSGIRSISANRTIEVFEIVEHLFIPKIELFQFFDEVGIEDCKLSREVRLDKEMFVHRLDRWGDSCDICNGRSRRNRHRVAVAHSMLLQSIRATGPVHRSSAVHIEVCLLALFRGVRLYRSEAVLGPIWSLYRSNRRLFLLQVQLEARIA